MEIIVKAHQSIWDIALQYCGSASDAFKIARVNNLSLTQDLQPGSILIVDYKKNNKVVKHYQNLNIEPATAVVMLEEERDFWIDDEGKIIDDNGGVLIS